MTNTAKIHYTISPESPFEHLFSVSVLISEPSIPQTVSLPNWIPGSYLIRDFSKHLIDIKAYDKSGNEIKLSPITTSQWQFAHQGSVEIRYQVYAWDLSVRGAHFDQTHAFFNGTSTFLAVDGQRDAPVTMTLEHSDFSKTNLWKAASTLPQTDVQEDGFGNYYASNYHELVDHPFEIGLYQELEFGACGIPHKMVFTGQTGEVDFARLKQDLIKICEYELELFGKPYPIDEYLFQVTVTGSDYGGLEHRSSTALICSRYDLPYPNMDEASDGYLQFLELCSHEYFHTWNVKRIQPAIYQNHLLDTPAYTEQLWWFEGVTSYYDALILLRCGIIDEKTYLKLLGQQITRVYRMPGRFKQSLFDSSWTTWTKFYQQDKNAPNAIMSYYTKGSVMALALDLTIRQHTQNQFSLDDVLLHLWKEFGEIGKGIEEGVIQQVVTKVTGLDLTEFFEFSLHSVDDYDFEQLFKSFGYDFSLRAAKSLTDTGGEKSEKTLKHYLGANFSSNNGGVQVGHIWNDGSLAKAGITSDDVIIAVNGLKVTSASDLERLLERTSPENAVWQCHYFRRDELMMAEVTLIDSPLTHVVISRDENAENFSNALTWI